MWGLRELTAILQAEQGLTGRTTLHSASASRTHRTYPDEASDEWLQDAPRIASHTYDGERTAHVSTKTPAQEDTGRKWVRTDSQRTSLAPPQSTVRGCRKDRERSHGVRDQHVGVGLVGRAALTRRRTNRRCRRNRRQMVRFAAKFEAMRQRAGDGGRAKAHGLPGLRLMTARRTC